MRARCATASLRKEPPGTIRVDGAWASWDWGQARAPWSTRTLRRGPGLAPRDVRSPLGDMRPRERRGIGARRAVRGGVPFCCSCGSRGHQARGLIKPTALHLKQMKVTLRLGLFIRLTVLCRSFIMLETTKERTTKGVDHEPGSSTDLQVGKGVPNPARQADLDQLRPDACAWRMRPR